MLHTPLFYGSTPAAKHIVSAGGIPFTENGDPMNNERKAILEMLAAALLWSTAGIVMKLIPEELRTKGMFPAGRLDKDSTGALLITDDGELAHRMLSPVSHVPKTYFVRLEKPVGEELIGKFAEGMEIDGGEKCLPAELTLTENDCECYLVLHEGKYHQVKRMFACCGNKVVFLKRVRIGGLDLDPKLPLGACLEILHKDVDKLLTH